MPVPDFVLALRERIGHDLLWLPGVSGVVVAPDGRLLLGQRADSGEWAVPSGILEPGEEPARGLVREIEEETGVAVFAERLAAVTTTETIRYPNGDLTRYVDLCFLCRPVDDAAVAAARVADDESTAVGWFRRDELPAPLAASSAQRLDHAAAAMADPSAGPYFAT